MNSLALGIYTDVIRLQTETMGMQAENKNRELRGESMAYTEKDFIYIAAQMEIHAAKLREM